MYHDSCCVGSRGLWCDSQHDALWFRLGLINRTDSARWQLSTTCVHVVQTMVITPSACLSGMRFCISHKLVFMAVHYKANDTARSYKLYKLTSSTNASSNICTW